MSTLPPPATKAFPADSLEKRIYSMVEGLKDFLPIVNDRNRLGFSLYKYMIGEGDPPDVTLRNAKVKIQGISPKELLQKLEQGVEAIKQN